MTVVPSPARLLHDIFTPLQTKVSTKQLAPAGKSTDVRLLQPEGAQAARMAVLLRKFAEVVDVKPLETHAVWVHMALELAAN